METIEQKSDPRNKIFYIIFFLLIVASIGATYLKIVVFKNYQIVAQVSCDPTVEKCFISTCDPATDDTCTASSTPTYYKNISKKAATIYDCENTTDKIGCGEELSCTEGEVDCSYTLCDPANLAEGETCSE